MKKYKVVNWIILILCLFPFLAFSQSKPRAIAPIPTQNQLAWHKLEKYAFIHFSINTFTDKEWGFGNENPSWFNPTELDTDQWARTVKEAGLKAIILTCKHHDGFTLWPSKFTQHSVASSPYTGGKGDIVKSLATSCKKFGLKFGIYLSPWDRNHPQYGQKEYIEYYRNQLKELFENYGQVFEMWFDGANGGDGFYGGANEKRNIDGKSYYNWPTTIEMVQQIEPKILFFSDAGPDIRWVGNERGTAGATNWNSISTDTLYAGKAGIELLLNQGHENGSNWVPAEVDVSIRPGWFWHESENDKVKSAEKLFEIYLSSVGRGSNLLLNIPPDKRGLIHENDINSLKGWTKILNESFGKNIAKKAKITAKNPFSKDQNTKYLLDENSDTFWAANAANTSILLTWNNTQTVKFVEINEYIALGQRVKAFEIQYWDGKIWQNLETATTIGYKRILKVRPTKTSKIKINILNAKAEVVLADIKVY